MVRQYKCKAKTARGRDTFIYLSEEVTGSVHIITHSGGVYVDKGELIEILQHLTDAVGDEHDEDH